VLRHDKCSPFEAEIERLKKELKSAHRHILMLQDEYNRCRDFFSNVRVDEETEDTDEEISLEDCDLHEAKELLLVTEQFAMSDFRDWFSKINELYKIANLDEYEKFKWDV
jgi:hypothetical protein